MFLLDTCVVIGLLKQAPAALELVDRFELDFAKCAVSQITRMELLSYPNLQESEAREIIEFLAYCQVVLLDEEIENIAIAWRRGSAIKLPDAIIAATAYARGLQLITLDVRLQQSFQAGFKKYNVASVIGPGK